MRDEGLGGFSVLAVGRDGADEHHFVLRVGPAAGALPGLALGRCQGVYESLMTALTKRPVSNQQPAAAMTASVNVNNKLLRASL